MKIQLGEEESVIPEEPKPIEFSTPLKIEEINKIYDREKTDYFKIAIKLNQIELERGRGLPYIYQNKVYLGKRPKQTGAGVVSKTLGHILATVGDVIGL